MVDTQGSRLRVAVLIAFVWGALAMALLVGVSWMLGESLDFVVVKNVLLWPFPWIAMMVQELIGGPHAVTQARLPVLAATTVLLYLVVWTSIAYLALTFRATRPRRGNAAKPGGAANP